MKQLIILLFYFLNTALPVYAQDPFFSAMNYYNDGVVLLEEEKYMKADSLFTLSLNLAYDVDAFFNRSLARKKLGNESGFCNDMFMATANGDSVARIIFLKKCTENDTVFMNSDNLIVDRTSSVKMKISAKRKFDNNTDIVTIDSTGILEWSYLADTLSKDTSKTEIVERMPAFPGGETSLVKFLAHNIKYPLKSRENGVQGTAFVTFVINREGRVEEVKVLKGVNYEIDREAIRVVSGMPRWFPGMQDGRFVNVQYNLSIRFTLGGK